MRTSTGVSRRRRHKKILAANKGYRMTKSKLYKVSHEAFMHAGQYSYEHRRRRLSQMRNLWIKRLNAAAVANGLKYNTLIAALAKAKIAINKKLLSEIAYSYPEVFTKITKSF
ncbi:50S ribosomal protein L20 [Candidatus Dojkabacteria bacterium]|jgi:large subunit ribosomal protein L20|nr:50S ribosomal protein L20 [Candidatus Dojkabacteria bacterium]